MPKKVDFVDDIDFLRGAFDFGVTVDDGIKELVDNSLDANATRIFIELNTNKEGEITLSVIDDGDGIPTEFEGVEGIPHVMAFGNTEISFSSKSGKYRIGKFGFGLSHTITCLAKGIGNAYVWSKTTDDANWRMSRYNFQDLVENECKLPAEIQGMPPTILVGDSGTIVRIEIRTGAKMRASSIQTRVLRYLGRAYRKYIQNGVEINFGTSTFNTKPKWKKVSLKDPLALHPDSEEVKGIGLAVNYPVDDLILNGENKFLDEEIIDPKTGTFARIQFKLSRISRTKFRARMNQYGNNDILKDDEELEKARERYGIGMDGQGFSLLREGREIQANGTFGIYNKHEGYNYIHGEIDFPVALDRFFGVQTNKSRHNVHKDMKKAMAAHLEDVRLKAYYDNQKDGTENNELKENGPKIPESELIGKRIRPLLKQPRLTDEEIRSAEAMRLEMLLEEKERYEALISPRIEEVKQNLADAESNGDDESINTLTYTLNELTEVQREWIERIESRWKTHSPNRIFIGDTISRDVYKMRDAGDEAHITINNQTEFYRKVYSKVLNADHKSLKLKTLMDLMFSSLGYAEFLDGKSSQEKSMFWQVAREEVSLHIDQFVKLMPDHDNGGESDES